MDSKQDLNEEIAKVAYGIYEQEGPESSDVVNWLKAERIVLERLSVQEPSKETKKVVSSREKGEATRKKMK